MDVVGNDSEESTMLRSKRKRRQEGQSSLVMDGDVLVHVMSPWSPAGNNPDSQSPIADNWDEYMDEDAGGNLNSPHIEDSGEDLGNGLGHQPLVVVPQPACRDRLQARTKGGRFAPSSDGSCNDERGSSKLDRGKKKHVDTSWIVTSPMSGGSIDVTVIPSYGGHVAFDIWQGKERPVTRCHGRYSICQSLLSKFSECKTSVQERIKATGLSHLSGIMYQYVDMALISAFIERWQPDTNSFHMPFGEMTIMLHDVHCILDIPIDGDVLGIVGVDRSNQSLQKDCAELFGIDVETFVRDNWRCGGMDGNALLERCVVENQNDEYQFMCYMLTLLASTLFVDKSGGRVRPQMLAIFSDPTIDIGRLSWGSATLAYLYQHLGMASRAHGRGIAGCCTLLQAWIYEYFPMFRPVDKARTDSHSRAWRWYSGDTKGNNVDPLQCFRRDLDALQANQIEWMPYGRDFPDHVPRTHYRGLIRHYDVVEPYLPDRCVRQLGYIQGIPEEPYRPDHACRPVQPTQYAVTFSVTNLRQIWKLNLSWYLPDKFAHPLAPSPDACTPAYMPWFLSISHPIIQNPTLRSIARDSHPSGLTYDQRDKMLSNLMSVMEPVANGGIPDSNLPPEWQIVLSTLYDTYVQYQHGSTTNM